MDPQAAHETVVDLHKRAFFGRLAQHGFKPENEKEAAALLDLGLDLFIQNPGDSNEKYADDDRYGDGQFAQAKRAFDELVGSEEIAPGFPAKRASAQLFGDAPQLPNALVESAYNAAYDLAHDPQHYHAAVVKRAMNEAAQAEDQGEESNQDS
ncbi:MAG TPA: hypothetical protein VM487_24225 [Phycisphaerae bacterium]|nr:hypothetical protein [Phycisphaerae bacterium]